jgi:hypothetical protein
MQCLRILSFSTLHSNLTNCHGRLNLVEHLQNNYMVSMGITNELRELGWPSDHSLRSDIFTCKRWGSIGLSGSLTFGTTIFGINTSQTLTTTKSSGISLPPTLLLGNPKINVVATLCSTIGSVRIISMPTQIYKRNQCQNNIQPQKSTR